ncbi:hypothetical protein EVAR_58497_1, partial [Eumeta japonica]
RIPTGAYASRSASPREVFSSLNYAEINSFPGRRPSPCRLINNTSVIVTGLRRRHCSGAARARAPTTRAIAE